MVIDNLLEKQIPHNTDAEEALVGALLLNGKMMREVNLSPDDFYSERNKGIYQACQNLYKRLEPIDQITVGQELTKLGLVEKIGGIAYLLHVISMCPTSLEAPHYANIISNLSRSRQIIELSEKIADIGYKSEDVSKIDDLFLNFKKNYSASSRLVTSTMAANDIVNLTSKYSEPGHNPKWGFLALDNITAGIYPEYVIFGARPSVGKTQLFIDIIQNLVDQHIHVLLASAEMSQDQVHERNISREIGMSILDLRKNGLKEDQKDKMMQLAARIEGDTIHYLSGKLYFRDVYKEALYLRERGKLEVLFIDYIGALLDCYVENKDSQTTRISRISNKIQAMCHELGIPVIVASQLNREVEHRSGGFNKDKTSRKPQLSDLRDSGSLEQDADVVFLLHRDELESGEMSPFLSIKMAKNRQLGAAKAVTLQYNFNLHRYVDSTNREED